MSKASMRSVVWFVGSLFASLGPLSACATSPDPAPTVTTEDPAESSASADVTLNSCQMGCRQANAACVRACIHDPGSDGDCGCPEEFSECVAACPP